MTTLNDRERGEEAKFAYDQDTAFRITARRNRLVGEWAADHLGLTDAKKTWYVREIVQADFEEPGDGDVIRRVLTDFSEAGLAVDEAEVRQILASKAQEAQSAVLGKD